MSRIFIDRLIFAWVIAILIMLLGLGAISGPDRAVSGRSPPRVNIRATIRRLGANAAGQLPRSQQQLTGLDECLFPVLVELARNGHDQCHRKGRIRHRTAGANVVRPRSPACRNRFSNKVSVSQIIDGFLLIIGVYDDSGRTDMDVSDYLSSSMQDAIARVPALVMSTSSALPMPCALARPGQDAVIFAQPGRCD
jgi:multidrug efflux pump